MNISNIVETATQYKVANEDLNLWTFYCRRLDYLFDVFDIVNKYKLILTSHPRLDILDDLDENKCFIYSGGDFSGNHPLVDLSKVESDLVPGFEGRRVALRYLELDRAIHDIIGHYPNRLPFTFGGELAAYLETQQYFDGMLRNVHYTNTIGTLCYYQVYGHPLQKPVVMDARPIGELL